MFTHILFDVYFSLPLMLVIFYPHIEKCEVDKYFINLLRIYYV